MAVPQIDVVEQQLMLALQYQQVGQWQQAEALYHQIQRIRPSEAEVPYQLGVLSYRRGQLDAAREQFEQAIKLRPEWRDAHFNLGVVQQALYNVESAISSYQQALQADPTYGSALINLGLCLRNLGRIPSALECFLQAKQLDPDRIEIQQNLANLYQDLDRFPEAVLCYRQALELDPNFLPAYMGLGYSLQQMGDIQAALTAFEQALQRDPDSFQAKLAVCMSQIPILYTDPTEIESSRQNYERSLTQLSTDLKLDTPERIQKAVAAVGSMQPFYLTYQGHNDRDLQQISGRMIERIMKAGYPQWSQPLEKKASKSREKLRIGIASAYFCRHSNWTLPIRGWVEGLDRDRFSLYGFYLSTYQDEVTDNARELFETFTMGISTIDEWCHRIRSLDLDVLIYPEIGMDPMILKLAALRLAPVQCSSWGHPQTSGLPTIDYYLSSETMETDHADECYTEKLIRLPGLSTSYQPERLENQSIDFSQYGIQSERILFLCTQSLFKYLPQYDQVLTQIAQQVPDCQFIFLQGRSSNSIRDRFLQRLRQAFAESGLISTDHLVLLPYLNPVEFAALNSIGSVFLDSIGWSGCNTTLAAIDQGLPIVTLPGSVMRSRHSAAMLYLMGVSETIAQTTQDYVQIAVKLATDPSWRQAISQQIVSRRQKLIVDPSPIRVLEAFLIEEGRK